LSKPKKSIFYGWKIVNSLFWINAILMGSVFIFGVFFKSLETEFNLSRATTSSIVSVYMVAMAGVAILGGWALDRYGPKRIILIMAFLTGLGLLLTSQVFAGVAIFYHLQLVACFGFRGYICY